METRGPGDAQPTGRPAIARRSCDHCRTRKIGCDRASPCSNCVNARLQCTHSAVASRPREARQRVLVSTEYERKIDDIAAGIAGIWNLIQDCNPPAEPPIPRVSPSGVAAIPGRPPETLFESASSIDTQSARVGSFVDYTFRVDCLRDMQPGTEKVLAALGHVLKLQDDHNAMDNMLFSEGVCRSGQSAAMPSLDATVSVLRWAKEHSSYYVVSWLSQILPLEQITQVCQKVYFAVNDYTEVEFVLAAGCLDWLFSEYAILKGEPKYRNYAVQCRSNLQSAITRLTLLMPATQEVIAALVVGALHALDIAKANLAWTLASAASNLCQTLGYHRMSYMSNDDETTRVGKMRLFWTVFKIDKGLSLRLGRPSTIQEWDIPIPDNSVEARWAKTAGIQARVYEQLYSISGLVQPHEKRAESATELASELQRVMSETPDQDHSNEEKEKMAGDKMRRVYQGSERVLQFSLLTMIYRATPKADTSTDSVSDECVAAAHDAMVEHQQCMAVLRGCTADPSTLAKYINWTILYMPFLPLMICFSRVIKSCEMSELSRIERFAVSLQPANRTTESSILQRLFQLLYETARLFVESRAASTTPDHAVWHEEFNGYLNVLGFAPPSAGDAAWGRVRSEEASGVDRQDDELGWHSLQQQYPLGDWYRDDPDVMGLLDDDVSF